MRISDFHVKHLYVFGGSGVGISATLASLRIIRVIEVTIHFKIFDEVSILMLFVNGEKVLLRTLWPAFEIIVKNYHPERDEDNRHPQGQRIDAARGLWNWICRHRSKRSWFNLSTITSRPRP
jgi:hypothetical protein